MRYDTARATERGEADDRLVEVIGDIVLVIVVIALVGIIATLCWG